MMFATTVIKRSLYKCSPALARVINATEVTRPDALKKIWAYIKDKKLQEATKLSIINADPILKDVFKKESFKNTEIMRGLSENLTKIEKTA